jgi:CspA family cold shock protein
MATGKVKWFNNAKGYGFILPESGGEDLFAHYSSIEMDGYKTLKAGQDVDFDVVEGPKGYHAVNIRGGASEASDEASPGGASEDIHEASPDSATDSSESDTPVEQIDSTEPEPASPEVAS